MSKHYIFFHTLKILNVYSEIYQLLKLFILKIYREKTKSRNHNRIVIVNTKSKHQHNHNTLVIKQGASKQATTIRIGAGHTCNHKRTLTTVGHTSIEREAQTN
jgi:hypothetical protein